MDKNEQKIKKNKVIITVSVLVIIIISVAIILINSTPNDTIEFQYVKNQKTGEPLGLITSLFLYALFWGFAGMLPSCAIFLFVLFIHEILHIKDKQQDENYSRFKLEEDFYYGGNVSFKFTYIAVLILMILHISNIVTIHIF